MNRYIFLPCIALAFFALSQKNYAQEKTTEAMTGKHVTAIRISDSSYRPTIDGKLDDALWRQVPVITGLHQIQPKEFAPATERTQFQIAYDSDNLYIAVNVYETDPSRIDAAQPIQGKPFETDDQLHISIDPFNRDRDGYFFQVNANGVRREALIGLSVSDFNPNWRIIWDAASEIHDEGWSTEISIPFKSLSFDPNTDTWGFNIGRVIRRKGEFLAWSSRGADVWEMGPNVMGDLGPITEVEQGLGLDVKVSGVISHREDNASNHNDTDAEPSVDIFYKPNPNLTLAATINTDFSATEIDDRVVNLTRFDVMLPEKRDFFLQDANQFSFGNLANNGMPYFSRKIGIDNFGQPVSLEGGVKLSGRFDNYNIGALVIRQEASGLQHKNSDIFVVRGSRNVLKESSIGFIYTNGDPTSDRSNDVFGVDFIYNNSNAFGGSLVQSNIWYQESDDDISLDDEHAYGFTLAYPNSKYSVDWSFKEVGRNFNPALGFVNRKDIRQNNLNGAYRNFFNGGWIKSYNPKFEFEHITDTQGNKQSDFIKITPLFFDSIAGDEISLSFIDQFEHLDNDFSVVNALSVVAGDYDGSRWNFRIASSIARPFSISAEFEDGDFYNGDRFDQKYYIDWRPWSRVMFSAGYEESDIELDTGHFTTRLSTFGTELAISRNWAWLLSTQFDNVSNQLGINSRLRWMPRAGKELYFVINKGKQRLADDSFISVYDEYVIKASYTFRF